MSNRMVPPSLKRTNSNGSVNTFLLIQNKFNDELLILSRDDLPAPLQIGKLNLNQKIHFRDENRKSIEATILYISI